MRLPGRGSRFDGVRFVAGRSKLSKLWLGRDHLLNIETSGFTEDYKRFYYRDIQSLVIRRTSRRRNINIVMGLGLLTFALIGVAAHTPSSNLNDNIGSTICLVISGIFALAVLINSLLGPTCIVHLKTEVQLEVLPSLHRLRTVKKALKMLKPRIIEAQGSLSSEGIQTQLNQSGQATHPRSVSSAARGNFPETPKPYESRAHLILFCAMLMDGLLNLLQIYFHSTPMVVIGSITTLTAFGGVVFALIKQYQTDLKTSLRRLTWATSIYLAICFFIGNIEATVVQVQQRLTSPNKIPTQWDSFKAFAEIDPMQTPWLLWILIILAMCSFFLGAFGLILLKTPTQPLSTDGLPETNPVATPATTDPLP